MTDDKSTAPTDGPARTTTATETSAPPFQHQEVGSRGELQIRAESRQAQGPDHLGARGESARSGRAQRPTENLLVERWYGGLRDILGDILNDAVITAVILGILHLLHLYISVLSFDKWFVDTVDAIHKWGAIIVLLMVSVNFIRRVFGYLFRKA